MPTDPLDVVLWDFGNTLADERCWWTCPAGVPTWSDAWAAFMATELCSAWERGDVPVDDVAAQLAAATGMPAEAVRSHLQACGRQIRFHERTWSIARARENRQALVTVNPVEFFDIVATYALDRVFETIVVSGEEHTDNKSELCDRALRRLGIAGRSRALLVDNLEPNVESWLDLGGLAYHFEGDDSFADDLSSSGWGGLARQPLRPITGGEGHDGRESTTDSDPSRQ
jgi:hypothetical protein